MQDDLKKEIRDGMQKTVDRLTNKLVDVYDVIVKQYATEDDPLVPKIMEYVIKDIAKGIDKTCREAEEEITKKMNDDKYLKELVETVMKENTHE